MVLHVRMLLLHTEITEANLCAFVNRLFHEDFSSIDGTNLLPFPCFIYINLVEGLNG